MGGLNTVDSGAAMPATDCILAYNLIAAELGLRSRLGSREWVTGLTGAADNQVRSILPFQGSAANGTKDKLFVTTSSGIWGASASTAAPGAPLIAFGITSGSAGRGICTVMVTAAGHFLVYADEENGLFLYTESTDTWTQYVMGAGAGQIANVDPASICHVMVFKDRLWLTEKNSARGWYLPTGSIAGAAAQINFGYKFRAGGSLVALANWTVDGGNGLDDNLVAVSQGGDVAIYQGTDPSSASTFGLKGVWYVGALPAGRRVMTNFGGDVLILSKLGVMPLSKLVIGNPSVDRTQYATAKISNLFNSLALASSTVDGWSLYIHPEDNALVVLIPTTTGAATTQLVMSLWNRSWWRYRDLPMFSAESWNGKLYFGTADGRVLINDGYVDGVTLADPNSYTAVQYSMIGAFQTYGSSRQKRVQFIRPTILTQDAAPQYTVAAKYRFDFSELASVSGNTSGANAWDTGVFDTATWSGDYAAAQAVTGGSGMGIEIALALRGTAASRTVFVGAEVLYDQGGVL